MDLARFTLDTAPGQPRLGSDGFQGFKDAVIHIAAAVRSAHDTCSADLASGIRQIDVSNAFNTISRTAILGTVWADFPSMGKWVE